MNFELFLKAVERSDGKVRNKPLQLFLEVTTACNLRCQKCGKNFNPNLREANEIPFSVLKGFRDYFKAAFEVNTFGYGEMFLYRDLEPLVKILKTYGCKTTGITNGMMVKAEDITWLVAKGYDELAFSIDGATAETMKRLRGADLDKIIATLRQLHEEKEKRCSDLPRIIVNFVAQKDNYHELPDLIRTLSGLGIFFLGVNTLHGMGGAGQKYYDEYRLAQAKREDFEAVMKESSNLAGNTGIGFSSFVDLEAEWHPAVNVLSGDGEPRKEQDLSPYYCYYPWTTLYLAADKTTQICCYMRQNFGVFSKASDLDAIWHGESPLAQVRKAVSKGLVHPACQACVARGRYQFSQSFVNNLKERFAH